MCNQNKLVIRRIRIIDTIPFVQEINHKINITTISFTRAMYNVNRRLQLGFMSSAIRILCINATQSSRRPPLAMRFREGTDQTCRHNRTTNHIMSFSPTRNFIGSRGFLYKTKTFDLLTKILGPLACSSVRAPDFRDSRGLVDVVFLCFLLFWFEKDLF